MLTETSMSCLLSRKTTTTKTIKLNSVIFWGIFESFGIQSCFPLDKKGFGSNQNGVLS